VGQLMLEKAFVPEFNLKGENAIKLREPSTCPIQGRGASVVTLTLIRPQSL
jgi:hypothetical protein